jgi:ceramide glucosyltransferase
LSEYPLFDVRLFVETEDSYFQTEDGKTMGPNPKIRSMSRAYKEAKGDIVWIIDCNVWINKGTCGRMVDRLCGYGGKRPNKFVHQLPLVVDVSATETAEAVTLMSSASSFSDSGSSASEASQNTGRGGHAKTNTTWGTAGGRFEEAWFSAAHAKFYTAINTVLIAPCIVGKSNMFRRTHLNALTEDQGIDFFSHNICEDHLIGDLVWKRPVPSEVLRANTEQHQGSTRSWGNHALNFGDFAIQPVANMSIGEFFNRRVRWLRVRKFTVVAATLVEPGTESLLCTLYGAFALTTLPFFHQKLGIPQTWTAFSLFFLLGVTIWAAVDWTVYCHFHSGSSIQVDENTPTFARFGKRREFRSWIPAWIGRELLAFPIWAWAVYGGVTVKWRGKKFRVGMDMRVREVEQRGNASARRKARSD